MSKIIACTGCFDVLHLGHVRYLKYAASLGDFLFVGINSDESVKKIKGPLRPINCQEDRIEFLYSLKFVSQVFIFDEINASGFLKRIKPNIWVKGGDYNLKSLHNDELEAVKEYGGEIKFYPLEQGFSTSNILIKLCE